MKYTIFFLFAVGFIGCSQMIKQQTTDALVQIDDEVLYRSDVDYITEGLIAEDSAAVARDFIHDWILNNVEYKKANRPLDKALETMVANYRRMLYIHQYEQNLLKNKPDVVFSDSMIEAYYNNHPQEFILSDNLIKGAFLIIHTDAPNKQSLLNNLKSIDSSNIGDIEKYCLQYGTHFDIFLDEWRSLSQIRVMIPMHLKDLLPKIRHNAVIQCGDSAFDYILYVSDKCLSGEIRPKELAKEEIRQKLIKQDEFAYINDIREAIYKEAIDRKKVIFYER